MDYLDRPSLITRVLRDWTFPGCGGRKRCDDGRVREAQREGLSLPLLALHMGEGGHEPRDTVVLLKLEEARKQIPP